MRSAAWIAGKNMGNEGGRERGKGGGIRCGRRRAAVEQGGDSGGGAAMLI